MTLVEALQQVDDLVQSRRREFETRRLEASARSGDLAAVEQAMAEFDEAVGNSWAALAERLHAALAAGDE